MIGHPVIYMFGLKATTMVWTLFAVFFGLILSMAMWPSLWRKIYSCKEGFDAKKVKWHQTFKFIPWQLAVMFLIIGLFSMLIGSFSGFENAYKNLEGKMCPDSTYDAFPCEKMNVTCDNCLCEYSPSMQSARVYIPIYVTNTGE